MSEQETWLDRVIAAAVTLNLPIAGGQDTGNWRLTYVPEESLALVLEQAIADHGAAAALKELNNGGTSNSDRSASAVSNHDADDSGDVDRLEAECDGMSEQETWQYDSANQEIVNFGKAPDVEQFACIDPDEMRDLCDVLNKAEALATALRKAKDHLDWIGYGDVYEAESARFIDLPEQLDAALRAWDERRISTDC